MANRFYSPNQQFADNTGLPYAGGSLAFYASGTSTPLNTYSDSALTIANTNPVVLDSAGRAGNIFLQNLAYKVVLSDANSNPIWTDDPVYSSDYSARAKLLTGSGSPNGVVAGTAGSTGIGADTYWDATNNILYVCTTTGTSSTAVWTAVNASTAASVVPQPQGYLTLVSGTPILASDATNAAVYYTPYVGNTVPIYNGTSFVPIVFSELALTLTSSQAASTIYDVFVFNNSGVLTLATGPAWTSSTAGSGARGSGASTSQLSRLSGIWVNAVQMSGKNGAATYSITANQATYLGSIFIDATPGQTTCHRSYGQSRKWGVWNAYNRVPTYLKAGPATASYGPYGSTGGYRAANSDAANSLTVFSGLPEEIYDLSFSQVVSATIATTLQFIANIAIGLNSSVIGKTGTAAFNNQTASPVGQTASMKAEYLLVPSIGINSIGAFENNNGSTNNTSLGTETNFLLRAQWRA